MFVVQHRTGPKTWKTMQRHRFATEAQAWQFVASLDEDGFVDRAMYRVRPA